MLFWWEGRTRRCMRVTVTLLTTIMFASAIDRARKETQSADRAEVVARVQAAVERAGVTKAEFAASIGTSASRLSTYPRTRPHQQPNPTGD